MASFHAFLMLHSLVVFLLWIQEAAAAADVVGPITGTIKPSCPEKCGNISIPYPFGIGDGCYLDRFFKITCNYTLNHPMPRYGRNIDVLNISIPDGEMRVKLTRAFRCAKDNRTSHTATAISGKFTFSDTRNKFVAVGCNTMAFLEGRTTGSVGTGCMSSCDQIDDVINGSCSGLGCCTTSIPKGLVRYDVTVRNINDTASRLKDISFNPCSYAFLAEESWYNFSSSDLKVGTTFPHRVPAVLEWTIGKETCVEAQRNSTSYTCGDYTYCYNPGNAPGYRCNCSHGYQGNPYLKHGCQDIDECNKTLYPNPCKGILDTCRNTNGSYKCDCPPGHERRNAIDCVKPDQVRLLNKIMIGIALGLLFLLVSSSWLYWGYRKRKLMKLKEKFFKRNGGMMLKQLLQGEEAVGSRTAKIFTAEELKNATNKYDESQILGRGGFGTVYKGTLLNGTIVAIKKSKVVDRSQIDQFINEVLVLSQINHRNVVKLLGCCLETEVPLLVYEFITNGTLSEHLHEHENRVSSLSWDNRLRIAVEIAESLAYLHSAASVPIIHRDVKSTNILLDDSYTAKVSDFGASRLVPIDQTELNTLVQGTLGYLDPEYFHTSLLTDKSDVYSFGVLLAELLTGKMALSFDRPEHERSLANYFISSMKENRLHLILDDSLVSESSIDMHQLQQVGELIKKCLRVVGKKRPTMKDVAMLLDGLRRTTNHPWVFNHTETNNHDEENVYLLGEEQLVDTCTDSTIGAYESMNNQVLSSLNFGR